MLLFFLSFLAGVLTVLAPCVLPVLPIIIGGSVQGHGKRNPYVITASLALAIVLFTFLLKFSTLFINIPPELWRIISGVIILAFGLISLFPTMWDTLSIRLGLLSRSEKLLADSAHTSSRWSDVLIGLSLGPVFSSCSPTYFIILATVLPRSLAAGTLDLIAYAVGLALVLLLVSLIGQRFIKNARWAADPNGWFKRGLGILFLLVGLLILTGADIRFQTYIADKNIFNGTTIEQSLLQALQPNTSPATSTSATTNTYPVYKEITDPSGFVNATSVMIGPLIGKKVILVDFMTYSCINCIRTFPYLNAWYDKYKDQGLEIIGIHTPEFSFEKNINNVRDAMQRFGITFPVVLDNDYGTWNAYQNHYWPNKFLIDINGNIVYNHVGEGGDDEIEAKIQELLKQKMDHDHVSDAHVPTGTVTPANVAPPIQTNSPETYFGAGRNEYLGNGTPGAVGVQTLTAPATRDLNQLFLNGTWNFVDEYAENIKTPATVFYHYAAQNLFFVASGAQPVKVLVERDGKPLPRNAAGSDVQYDGDQSYVMIHEERLYNIISDTAGYGEHEIELKPQMTGLRGYTFTFG